MQLISLWWSGGIGVLLLVLSFLAYDKINDENLSMCLGVFGLTALSFGTLFLAIHNSDIRITLEARKNFTLIQQDWKIKEVIDEPSKPSDPKFNPSNNTYVVERVQNGVLLRGKILPRTGMQVVDVEGLGVAPLAEKKAEAK